MSWVPFNGGKRICFGKTFAEYVLRTICVMMAARFNFEFKEGSNVHPKHDSHNLPRNMMGQTHFPTLPVKLTLF